MNITLLIIGGIMLLGCFASVSSINSSSFDYDFAFILLIAGLVCIGFGVGFLDIEAFKEKFANFMPDKTNDS